MILHFKCLAMNGAHNYHKNINMYVLWCTTIGLKQEYGHKTSRRADMNLRFKPHFMAEIDQFFWYLRRSKWDRADVIWRHSCLYVVLSIDMYIYIHIERVIAIYIELLASQFTRLGDNRRNVNTSTVRTFLISWGQKTRGKYCSVDLPSHDMRSGLQ